MERKYYFGFWFFVVVNGCIALIDLVLVLADFSRCTYTDGTPVNVSLFWKLYLIFYVCLIVYAIYYQWSSEVTSLESIRLSYKTFRDFYAISDKVTYGVFDRTSMKRPIYIAQDSYKTKYHQIIFSFIDWIRFEIWLAGEKRETKRKEVIEKKKESSKVLFSMLVDIQQDIDNIKQKSLNEITQAKNILEEIKKSS